MSFKTLKLAATAALFVTSSAAMAVPFSSFDARSMAMGGVGVAVGNAATAPLFNPALLSITREDDDFALVLPTIGIRVADPDKLSDSIDKFQSGNYVTNLTNSITTLNNAIATANTTPTAANITAMQVAAGTVGNTTLPAVSTQLATLNNKPITVDGGVATVVSIPGNQLGIAFYANGVVTAGGLFQYKDKPTLDNLSLHISCLSTAADTTAINACNTTYGGGANPNFNNTTLQSSVNFRGVMLSEMGLAFSSDLGYMTWGLTPKIVKAQLFDVPINVNNTNQTGVSSSDYQANYSMTNIDLGVATYDKIGWRTGLVIKNVIPYTLDFKKAPTPGATPVANGQTLTLRPLVRVGVSHTTSWSTVALDIDVTRNDPAGFEQSTQYIALGGELNAWDWVQLRAGYRVDMVNSARNVTSVGLGLSPFGVPHFDIAVAGNASEIGASFQLGVHF